MILLPVALGMAARSWWPGGVRRVEPSLRRLSLAAILFVTSTMLVLVAIAGTRSAGR